AGIAPQARRRRPRLRRRLLLRHRAWQELCLLAWRPQARSALPVGAPELTRTGAVKFGSRIEITKGEHLLKSLGSSSPERMTLGFFRPGAAEISPTRFPWL